MRRPPLSPARYETPPAHVRLTRYRPLATPLLACVLEAGSCARNDAGVCLTLGAADGEGDDHADDVEHGGGGGAVPLPLLGPPGGEEGEGDPVEIEMAAPPAPSLGAVLHAVAHGQIEAAELPRAAPPESWSTPARGHERAELRGFGRALRAADRCYARLRCPAGRMAAVVAALRLDTARGLLRGAWHAFVGWTLLLVVWWNLSTVDVVAQPTIAQRWPLQARPPRRPLACTPPLARLSFGATRPPNTPPPHGPTPAHTRVCRRGSAGAQHAPVVQGLRAAAAHRGLLRCDARDAL